MQDRPSAQELLQATEGFLNSLTGGSPSPQQIFHARVARNVLAIIRRELDMAPALDTAERKRLHDLLNADGELFTLNQLLCERIRTGEMTLETAGLWKHLQETAIGKLLIDQPNYTGLKNIQKNQPE